MPALKAEHIGASSEVARDLHRLESGDSSPQFIYRPILTMSDSDVEGIRQINTQSFPVRYDDKYYSEVYHSTRHGQPLYTRVCEYKGQIIGAITYQFESIEDKTLSQTMSFSDKQGLTCYILTLAVISEFRRFGIGNKLVQQCAVHAGDMEQCKAIYLHVITYNEAAIRFYRSLGFKNLEKLARFYFIKDEVFDAFLFAKLSGNEEETTKRLFNEPRPKTLLYKLSESLLKLLEVVRKW